MAALSKFQRTIEDQCDCEVSESQLITDCELHLKTLVKKKLSQVINACKENIEYLTFSPNYEEKRCRFYSKISPMAIAIINNLLINQSEDVKALEFCLSYVKLAQRFDPDFLNLNQNTVYPCLSRKMILCLGFLYIKLKYFDESRTILMRPCLTNLAGGSPKCPSLRDVLVQFKLGVVVDYLHHDQNPSYYQHYTRLIYDAVKAGHGNFFYLVNLCRMATNDTGSVGLQTRVLVRYLVDLCRHFQNVFKFVCLDEMSDFYKNVISYQNSLLMGSYIKSKLSVSMQ